MNIVLLLTLVKERPILYDPRNELYKYKTEKDKEWREICTALGVTMKLAKTKWRSLKDCYMKHLRSKYTNAGQASSKYVRWQWAKHMEFMKPYVSFAPSIKKLEQQTSSEIQDLQSAPDIPGTQLSWNVQNTQSFLDVQPTQSTTDVQKTSQRIQRNTERRRRRTVLPPSTDRIIQYFENKEKNSHDATELIFLGYAKTIKNFSMQRQARIKLNIAKMIMEEEIAHSEETEASCSYEVRNTKAEFSDPLDS